MIIATVLYKLSPNITPAVCRAHFHSIAEGFREPKGLLSKHFICNADGSGWAGGIYRWQALDDAKAFYSGPWRDGIISRYGMEPLIEFYDVFAVTDNVLGTVEKFEELPARLRA